MQRLYTLLGGDDTGISVENVLRGLVAFRKTSVEEKTRSKGKIS